jgi:hypothetical protein
MFKPKILEKIGDATGKMNLGKKMVADFMRFYNE